LSDKNNHRNTVYKAIAVVIGTLVAVHGEQYLFAAVVLTGLIQIAFGLLKLGKFIRVALWFL
jgi:SulP family sulfate permease